MITTADDIIAALQSKFVGVAEQLKNKDIEGARGQAKILWDENKDTLTTLVKAIPEADKAATMQTVVNKVKEVLKSYNVADDRIEFFTGKLVEHIKSC